MVPDDPSPDDPSILAALAARLHAQGRLAEAVTAYTDTLRLDRRNPALLYGFGLVLRDLGQVEGAAKCFEAAFALDPDGVNPIGVDAADRLGTLRAGQGRFAEAEACQRAALARRADRAPIWNNLGNALSRQGRAAEALAAWRRGGVPCCSTPLFRKGSPTSATGCATRSGWRRPSGRTAAPSG